MQEVHKDMNGIDFIWQGLGCAVKDRRSHKVLCCQGTDLFTLLLKTEQHPWKSFRQHEQSAHPKKIPLIWLKKDMNMKASWDEQHLIHLKLMYCTKELHNTICWCHTFGSTSVSLCTGASEGLNCLQIQHPTLAKSIYGSSDLSCVKVKRLQSSGHKQQCPLTNKQRLHWCVL